MLGSSSRPSTTKPASHPHQHDYTRLMPPQFTHPLSFSVIPSLTPSSLRVLSCYRDGVDISTHTTDDAVSFRLQLTYSKHSASLLMPDDQTQPAAEGLSRKTVRRTCPALLGAQLLTVILVARTRIHFNNFRHLSYLCFHLLPTAQTTGCTNIKPNHHSSGARACSYIRGGL